MRILHPFTSLFLILVGVTLPLSPAFSAVVPVLSHSFEEDAIGSAPTGWDLYDPQDIFIYDVDMATFSPSDTTDIYSTGSTLGVPPDGSQAVYIYLGSLSDNLFGEGPVGLEQTLTSNLMANSQYNLQVAVGNPASGYDPAYSASFNFGGFPGYIIELLADDTVIASDDNSVSIAEGHFEDISISLTVGDSFEVMGEDLIGSALSIRLLNKNLDLSADYSNELIDWDSEVDFDNVRLSVSAVPVPAAVWLFGTALIGLIGIGSRKQKV